MDIKSHKWVLVVEDEDELRELICTSLQDHFGRDIKIVQSADGAEATTKINFQSFNCIVTDMQMPRKSGGDFILSVRESSFNETTPIIILSAHASIDVEKKFKFVNFLPKPFEPSQLFELVQNHLNLESTEKMVSANVLNCLLSSTMEFVDEFLGEQGLVSGEMSYKNKGEELKADYAAIINVKIGKVSNTFSILMEAETLQRFQDSSPSLKSKPLEEICRSMGFVILKHVLRTCGIIDSNQVSTNDIKEDQSDLIDKKGIVIPITNGDLNIRVFATTE